MDKLKYQIFPYHNFYNILLSNYKEKMIKTFPGK